ncbi:hypothetical protein GGF43_001575 [Coemansia sp. RSA 2618]|nr:hypothetical protein GGF43_001575 [Coemansia sp. RSA 2618]
MRVFVPFSVTTRKEVRDLTSSEWETVTETFAKMQKLGWITFFASIHEVFFPVIHGMSQFLPFHRRFVRYFEIEAQKINPDFALPYWNEFPDYRNAASSEVLSDKYLGGNGQGDDHCVMDGAQAKWTMTYPEEHCLRREFNDGDSIKPWYSPEYIRSIMERSNTMADFRQHIENTQHAIVHLGIQGDMSRRHSPNDLLFMLHHAFIDRIWSLWQDDGHASTFDGPGPDSGKNMTLDSKLMFFQESVESVMYLGRGAMCYEYESPSNEPGALAKRSDLNSELDNLPADVLCKWYPKSCAETTPTNNTTSNARVSHAALKQLPTPADITQALIDMQGDDAEIIQKVVSDALAFVNEMNAAGLAATY